MNALPQSQPRRADGAQPRCPAPRQPPASSSPRTQQGQGVIKQLATLPGGRGELLLGCPKPSILASTPLARSSLLSPGRSAHSVPMLQPPGSTTDLRAMLAWPQ